MKMDAVQNANVVWHKSRISALERERLNGHKSCVVWFTGLSASGKSTISHHVEALLHHLGCATYVLDGDNMRHGLCQDLGFDEKSRVENIRRVGEVAGLLKDAGIIALTAFISPYKKDRDKVKAMVGNDRFIEVYVDCPVEVCQARDPKGLYAKALRGQIPFFTGVSAPYEPPVCPDITIKSGCDDFVAAARRVVSFLSERKIICSKAQNRLDEVSARS